MLSADELELAAAGTFRALETVRMGDWLLRAAEGFTGRGNSALAAGDPGMPLGDAVREVRAWYAARGLPAVIAVPFPMSGPDGSAVDRLLAGQGWAVRGDPVIVMTAPPALIAAQAELVTPAGQETRPAQASAGRPAQASADHPASVVSVADAPGDEWLALYHYGGQELPPVARQLLTSAPWQAFASIREDGVVIAIGRVAGDGDWAGLTAIETHPGHRRRGLGTAVTAALAGVGVRAGYPALFLQVTSSNTGARALYAGMGFTGHHCYQYRLAPSGCG